MGASWRAIDLCTGDVCEGSADDVLAALSGCYPDAPTRVLAAMVALGEAMRSGAPVHEHAAYLALTVERTS